MHYIFIWKFIININININQKKIETGSGNSSLDCILSKENNSYWIFRGNNISRPSFNFAEERFHHDSRLTNHYDKDHSKKLDCLKDVDIFFQTFNSVKLFRLVILFFWWNRFEVIHARSLIWWRHNLGNMDILK